MIPLQPANSSLIEAHGYDAETQTLAIRFKRSSTVYHYADVSPETAAAFAGAESIGKHFGLHIRDKYQHTAIVEKPAAQPDEEQTEA